MANSRINRRNISGTAGSYSFLPQITDRTNEQFVAEILKIHENQYTPINHIPTILGRQINLLSLYNAVAKRGGFKKMNTEWSWEGVLADLNMPLKCANASVALRTIFQRYLEPFERLQRNKATINDIEEELQMESESRYKTAQRTTLSHCNFNPISMVYRADMHQISSHKRQEAGLSCELSDVVEFQKLELSLKSGLVNEIEFSLNTILLMSSQTDGVQLCRNHRLLDSILATVGIVNSDLGRNLSQHDKSTLRFLQFWNDTILSESGRKFLLPNIFANDLCAAPKLEPLDVMFKLYDELTIYDKEGQQIQLVASIVRNLALVTSNSRIISQNHQCMRLIILCCYASHFALQQLGLEMLAMLSFPVVGVLSETLADFLICLVTSEDRLDRLRGLEIITHLSDQKVCVDNTEFFNSLPKRFFSSLISMLIVHDLHIVVLALEAVYGLSEVDSCLCTKLVSGSSETLATLYILLSLEAQVMGTQSLIRIRVMQGPGVVTNGMSTTNRGSTSQYQTSPKQLATSLMPPPPVPTHKTPPTIMSISHTNTTKPHIYAATEASGTQIKAQITQKIYPVITKNNVVYPTHQSNGITPNSVPPIVKSELITTSSIPPIISAIEVQNIANTRIPTVTNFNHGTEPCNPPVVTIPPISPLSMITSNMTHPCISTISHNKRIPDKVSSQADIVIDNSHPVFVNKQDFVMNWLLSNYLESPQCTVPLFAMYKQLQVAVQNYFKDSEMVTAEEFHKLVRILFPQVQLVQLHTTAGTVEIHYYNLKVFRKVSTLDSLLEPLVSKCKEIQTNTIDITLAINNVPHINNAQSTITEDTNNDQKSMKRQASNMINGHSIDADHSDKCLNKRPRINNDYKDESHLYDDYNQSTPITPHLLNGLVTECNHDKSSQQSDDRHSQSKVYTNQIYNGSIGEELKHSDSETKTFSSSTVSPIHCEILSNGTDGSSEETMDLDLGRVTANILVTGAHTVTTLATVLSKGSGIIPPDTGLGTVPSSASSSPDTSPNKRSGKKNNLNQLGRTRSRFRNNNPTSKGKQRGSTAQRPHNLSYLYICEWDNCLQSFDKPQKVYGHVYTNHFMTLRTEVESMCFWAACNDTTQRTPLPLLNHVNEQHCNNVALESARQIRLTKEKEKSIGNTPGNDVVKTEAESSLPKLLNFGPPPNTSSNTLYPVISSSSETLAMPLSTAVSNQPIISTADCYSSNMEPISACSTTVSNILSPIPTMTTSTNIIQTHNTQLSSSTSVNESSGSETGTSRFTRQDPVQSTTTTNIQPTVVQSVITTVIPQALPSVKHPFKEGPVTKHIRFLSALILRNLCQCSADARRFVAVRHQQIFELSISGCESSRALSECLFYSSTSNTPQQK